MVQINLNKEWRVRYAPLYWAKDMLPRITDETLVGNDFVSSWVYTNLPCDVHMPLIENNIIEEPLNGLNSQKCLWIEKKSWWFAKNFTIEKDFFAHKKIELELGYLDLHADIFLNGFHIGSHESVHYPFVKEVRKYLVSGQNELVVRLTVGTETISDSMTAPYSGTVDKQHSRGEDRRVFLRKPQYVFGWDWGPRVATCGICGNACLKAYDEVAVRGLNVVTVSTSPVARVSITTEVENFDRFKTVESELTVFITLRGKKVTEVSGSFLLRSGINYIELVAEIPNAELWWPNGMGTQPLYSIEAVVRCGDFVGTFEPVSFGIRTLRLNVDKLSETERLFAIEINGIKTFCKGADWIPADAIYARVTDEKYRILITEAKEAHFTMLRIWGGGIYEKDLFYQLCDENGILVWQDLMFACASYPDNEAHFMDLVEKEITYQISRLRSHACLALWCGNNENQWIFDNQWKKNTENFYGSQIYDYLAPTLVRHLSPDIPYWNSSPYGGTEPNSNEIGDRHHWHDCTMNPDMEKRISPEEYDKVSSKFITEYGYIGPCSSTSIEKYHAGEPVKQFSEIWNWHNNDFEKNTVVAGITKHYADASKLSLKEYLLYAGICQGMMYGYSLESIRARENCWGGLFWMYSDCWGEVGWTIIDYYLERKPSWYYTKRAFAPVKLVMREKSGTMYVTGINDTNEPRNFPVEYGYSSFDGTKRDTKKAEIILPAFSRGIVMTFPKPTADLVKEFVFVAPQERSVADSAIFRSGVFRDLAVKKANLILKDFVNEGQGTVTFTVTTDVYAHAVHFILKDTGAGDALHHYSDDYFDMLPGELKHIVVHDVELEFSDTQIGVVSIFN